MHEKKDKKEERGKTKYLFITKKISKRFENFRTIKYKPIQVLLVKKLHIPSYHNYIINK